MTALRRPLRVLLLLALRIRRRLSRVRAPMPLDRDDVETVGRVLIAFAFATGVIAWGAAMAELVRLIVEPW